VSSESLASSLDKATGVEVWASRGDLLATSIGALFEAS